jgi:hypothetical protein
MIQKKREKDERQTNIYKHLSSLTTNIPEKKKILFNVDNNSSLDVHAMSIWPFELEYHSGDSVQSKC